MLQNKAQFDQMLNELRGETVIESEGYSSGEIAEPSTQEEPIQAVREEIPVEAVQEEEPVSHLQEEETASDEQVDPEVLVSSSEEQEEEKEKKE